ncbi:MAG TPA: MauE/DoxX family redox-associated membrane protein [Acidobacteriaceae bacterium]|nr:MauE/DoxX family redox-associated membrane protein [Acidobacteriaceae bacterium]
MIHDELRSDGLYFLQAGIALVWIAAAVGKARTPAAERRASVGKLVPGPAWMVAAIASALPAAELMLGLVLIVRWETPVVAAVSAVLFLAFAFLVGRATVRNSLDGAGCGCFGRVSQRPSKDAMIGPPIVARNFVLANLSILVATAHRCACSR